MIYILIDIILQAYSYLNIPLPYSYIAHTAYHHFEAHARNAAFQNTDNLHRFPLRHLPDARRFQTGIHGHMRRKQSHLVRNSRQST